MSALEGGSQGEIVHGLASQFPNRFHVSQSQAVWSTMLLNSLDTPQWREVPLCNINAQLEPKDLQITLRCGGGI